ncbi:protein strawberry notch homolog 1 isoform X2 [Drosophila obscura]|uniref:protein strawberry notch homolog 1 isoform X2 n=1 Tax=Drosophila obscura TaxID=7282 RepID=UPI001BB16634|nr:protein strawberry notch homolog 1 isoform X2 [Drosophila obscura]
MSPKVMVPNERKRERKRRAKKAQPAAPISRRDFLRMAEEDACSMYGGPGDPPPPVPERPAALSAEMRAFNVEAQLKPKVATAEQTAQEMQPKSLPDDFVASERVVPAVPIVEPLKEPPKEPIVAPIAAPIVAPIAAPIAAPIVAPMAAPIEQTFVEFAEQFIKDGAQFMSPMQQPVADIFDSLWAEFDEPATNWGLPAVDANLVPPTALLQPPQGELPPAAQYHPTQCDTLPANNKQSLHDLLDSLCVGSPMQQQQPPPIAAPSFNQSWDYMSACASDSGLAPPITQAFNQPMQTQSNSFAASAGQSWNSADNFCGVQAQTFNPPAGYQSWDSSNHFQRQNSMRPPVQRETAYQSWNSGFEIDTQRPPVAPQTHHSWQTVTQNPAHNGQQFESPWNSQSCQSGFNSQLGTVPQLQQVPRAAQHPLPFRSWQNQQNNGQSSNPAAHNSYAHQSWDTGLENQHTNGLPPRYSRSALAAVSRVQDAVKIRATYKPSENWSAWVEEQLGEQPSVEQPAQPAVNAAPVQKSSPSKQQLAKPCPSSDSGLVKPPKTRVRPADNNNPIPIPIQMTKSVCKNQVNTVTAAPTKPMKAAAQPVTVPKPAPSVNSAPQKPSEHGKTLQPHIKPPVTRVRPADNAPTKPKASHNTADSCMSTPKVNQNQLTGKALAQSQLKTDSAAPKPITRVRPADNSMPVAKSVAKNQIPNVPAPILAKKPAGQAKAMPNPCPNLTAASQKQTQEAKTLPEAVKPAVIPGDTTQSCDSALKIELENGAIISMPQVQAPQAAPPAANPRTIQQQQAAQQLATTGGKVVQRNPGAAQGFSGPMMTYIKDDHGADIPVSFMTGPDGLITQVTRLPPNAVAGRAAANRFSGGLPQLEPITGKEMQQILQTPNSYTTLHGPVNGPGGGIGIGSRAALGPDQAVEDEEVDYEEIGVAETFAEYWPTKLKQGMAHPDAVVETATLSSVELPDITYDLSLPAHFQVSGCLSALQLEAVIYACQAHERILPSGERAGFLLGDGAGVGKGRAIAGTIYNNYLKGRKRALWISVSNDLKFDAERDLQDIGAKIKVVALNKLKYCRIDSEENGRFRKGVIFCTYTALIGESLTAASKYQTRLRQLVHWLGHNFEGVIVFDECHKAKNLTMGNAGKSTKTGATVLELQKQLPMARVVYASATGASEPRNMAYMTRLGLWGPGTAHEELVDFVYAVERRGIGAMELVAMDMKLRGTYIARQLSFQDVSFRIQEVKMQPSYTKVYDQAAELWADIGKKFTKACQLMHVDSRLQKIITCQFWCAHQRFFRNLCIASKVNTVVKMTRHAMRHGKSVVIGLQSTGESRTLEHLERHSGRLTAFVSTSKMILQSFVEKHFPAPRREAFIELLSTGEFVPETRNQPPRAKKPRPSHIDWMDDVDVGSDDSDMDSLPEGWPALPEEGSLKGQGRKRRGRPPKTDRVERLTMQDRILQHLYENMLAARQSPGTERDPSVPQPPKITEDDVTRCILIKEKLLERVEELGRQLPPNTLDKLIAKLGGTSKVAEMTGRRGRVVCLGRNAYRYESRVEADTCMDLVNYREKQRFMEGEKYVAIISEAASSGISLQSDKRVLNQRRRLHITLELPWSADRAIQQFGRTHRSNQINSPEYVFVITNLAGERRFASTVAKRLESLGALTQGDRRATDARDLSQFNIDNSIGRNTLEHVMQQMAGERMLTVKHIPDDYGGNFHEDCATALAGVGLLSMRQENNRKMFTVEKDSNNITKFLNRILGCRVEVQNAIFKFFLGNMYALIAQMKRTGRFDLGILDLDAHGAYVTSVKLMRFTRQHTTGTAATELHTVMVERGMAFEQALAKYRREAKDSHEGFYILKQKRRNKNIAVLCLNGQCNDPVPGSTARKESSSSCSSSSSSCSSAETAVHLQLYRPNTGPQVKTEQLNNISLRYVKVPPEEAQPYWQHQYDVCLNKCSHVFWSRPCPNANSCEVGLRVRSYHVLSGLMLPIWGRIEKIIERNGRKIQIIRVKTDVNKKIVGTVVPASVYNELVEDLSADSKVSST